jgi:carbon-monoxide dehydrogenase large subunit
MEMGIGKPVRRVEDQRLLTGNGVFTDDVNLDGQAHGHVLRAEMAHADITNIDVAAAKAAPGVLAVLTGEDYDEDGLGDLPYVHNPAGLFKPEVPSLANRDGSELFKSPLKVLAGDRVRFVGQPVAFVVAETADQARTAAELIEVQYDALPVSVDLTDAMQPGAAQIWEGAPGNIAVDMEKGDAAATDAALAAAAYVVEAELVNPRVAQVPMEPRVSLASFDGVAGTLFMHADSQGVFNYKMMLSRVFAMEPASIHVVTTDVGGGFGARNFIYPEHVLIAWSSKRLGRPVKWRAERWECFASDMHGRDFRAHMTLGLDADGHFTALKIKLLSNVGAISMAYVPLSNAGWTSTGCYHFDNAYLNGIGVFTNTVPTGPYRGAGRPESIFNIERTIDIAAKRLGMDRVELRRKNMVPADKLPHNSAFGVPWDDVDFPGNMDAAMALAGWDGFEARRIDSEANGRLRGIGLANYFETPTGQPRERADVTVHGSGSISAVIGTGPTGQGHETVFAQVLCERLGVDFDAVRILLGDSNQIVVGGGSQSVRSMRLGGTVLSWASDAIIEKGKRIAAHVLEAAETDVAFDAGAFTIKGTDRTMSLFEVAKASEEGDALPGDLGGGLDGTGFVEKRLPAYPAGCAIVEVEVDPETGRVALVDYAQIDDCGRLINPLLAEGQVHGGIAQGAGQALMEGPIHDQTNGQIVAGTMLDYAMPRADNFPPFRIDFSEIPSASNPLGVKGVGEGGTTPAPAVIVSAIVDALKHTGIENIEMPVTSERIWRALTEL